MKKAGERGCEIVGKFSFVHFGFVSLKDGRDLNFFIGIKTP